MVFFNCFNLINTFCCFRRCHDVNDSFSSSVIFKIQEKWTVALSFRLKALTTWFNTLKETGSEGTSISELESLGKTIIEQVIRYCKEIPSAS